MTTSSVVEGIAHGVWASNLVALAAALAIGASTMTTAPRYRWWWAALGLCLVGPAAGSIRWRGPNAQRPAVGPTAPVASVLALEAWRVGEVGAAATGDDAAVSPDDPPAAAPRRAVGVTVVEGRWGLIVLLILGAGASLRLAGLGLGVVRALRVKRHAAPFGAEPTEWSELLFAAGTRRRATLLTSAAIGSPIVVGYLRPAVVIAPGLLASLTPGERRQVLLHEAVHVARRDDWTLLLQRTIEAVLWFSPMVWWLGRALDLDRELLCDQAVARRTGGRDFARTLLRLADQATADRTIPAPAILSAPSRLGRRIEALVGCPSRPARLGRLGFAGAPIAVTLAVAVTPIRTTDRPGSAGPEPVVLATRSGPTGVVRGPLGEALDRDLQAFADSGFSGTVLVAKAGVVVLEKGYGLANRAAGTVATASTRYALAGFTKSFTAAAILRLVEEGRLALSDPVGRYLPELTGAKATVTIDQLLAHRDGMTAQAAPVFRAEREDFLRALDRTPAQFAPGADYRYNDFGHSVLAVVIERITGQRYEDHVRARLVEPLGLGIGFEPDGGPVAVEYQGPAGAQTAIGRRGYLWGRRGSLGMVGTARDAHRWLAAIDDPRIISPWVRTAMLTPRAMIGRRNQTYGWDWIRRPTGAVVLRRVAGTPGFEGELLRDAENGWTAVILVNSRLGWRFRVWSLIERMAATN